MAQERASFQYLELLGSPPLVFVAERKVWISSTSPEVVLLLI